MSAALAYRWRMWWVFSPRFDDLPTSQRARLRLMYGLRM